MKQNNEKNKEKAERVPMIRTDLFDKAENEANQKLETHFFKFLSSYFDTDV